MTRRRVVVTGIGLASPLGNDVSSLVTALRCNSHGIGRRPDWQEIELLNTRLAAEVKDLDLSGYPRKSVRTVGRVGLLALFATDRAIESAVLDPDYIASGEVGLAYGSTHGSSKALETFCRQLFTDNSLKGLTGSTYLKFMSHTCAANLALHYQIRGRVASTCAACVSSSMGGIL